MGLFNRSKASSTRSASSLQIPDELAQRAELAYGSANFIAAAELYSSAVDKLHTMYVVGQCRYRQPSQSDASIAEGLVSAVGAALATDPNAPVRSLVEQSIGYLREITGIPQARLAADLYTTAMNRLSREIS